MNPSAVPERNIRPVDLCRLGTGTLRRYFQWLSAWRVWGEALDRYRAATERNPDAPRT